jgi:hypothetical protein
MPAIIGVLHRFTEAFQRKSDSIQTPLSTWKAIHSLTVTSNPSFFTVTEKEEYSQRTAVEPSQ